MLVLVAPGQGAQTPGFLAPWLELPGAADRLSGWSAAANLDLAHYGTKADADEIRDTKVAQPLLVAAGLLSAGELTGGACPLTPDAVAGHSVGEITAAVLAGVLSAQDAMTFVAARGRAMADAAAVTETGMAAVLGGDPDTVLAHLAGLGLTPANINGAGQIVAAGTMPQLAALAADKPEKARVIALKVAGAFHTEHMAPAVAALEALAPSLTVADPTLPYVSNADGQVVAAGADIVRRLVAQVSNPVRWDLCMETFKERGVTAMIEVSPGGTLVGLAKRALPGVRTLALKTPDDLEAARALVAEYGTPAEAVDAAE
ncbi:ACP S-malonyltransferase [Streptomyces sp. CBMA29]|uniref:ACP S-malonyltransferase n=1 Tax=Streptomyces sp. CBMA29 TaxID=1896314 RepID=UPI0016619632|nr:ACP S-malonyltransferase [Streptomyces sp. CBMA29]MBD0739661.1 ACP S-malonyltransferase [Streptomyces sp. CBMA29]